MNRLDGKVWINHHKQRGLASYVSNGKGKSFQRNMHLFDRYRLIVLPFRSLHCIK